MKAVNFQEALEIIESFPVEQREALIEIVQSRLVEERRDQLAQDIKEAQEKFRRGEVTRGTANDLMRELPE